MRVIVTTVNSKLGRFLKLSVPSLAGSMAMAGLRDDVKPR
jgi:hypothetical protein